MLTFNLHCCTYSDSTEFGLCKVLTLFGIHSFGGLELSTIVWTDEGE